MFLFSKHSKSFRSGWSQYFTATEPDSSPPQPCCKYHSDQCPTKRNYQLKCSTTTTRQLFDHVKRTRKENRLKCLLLLLLVTTVHRFCLN